jgi:flagellar biosynthetic protein FliR
MIDQSALTRFLYITARMSGFILFNPILGRRNVPGIFRGGMVLVLSVFVASVSTQTVQVPAGIMELCVRLILELALGLLLSVVVEFFFYIPQLAGQAIDTQMGMTMNQIYDSGSQSNLSVSSVLLNTLMTLLFFAANGHHTLLRIMLTSEELVSYGAVHIGTEVLDNLLQLFVECTLLAVKLCLPVLAAELIGQLGMGVLMKVIPQINVFSINIELKVMIGLALQFLLICPFGEFLLQAEMTMLNSIQQVLSLSA